MTVSTAALTWSRSCGVTLGHWIPWSFMAGRKQLNALGEATAAGVGVGAGVGVATAVGVGVLDPHAITGRTSVTSAARERDIIMSAWASWGDSPRTDRR